MQLNANKYGIIQFNTGVMKSRTRRGCYVEARVETTVDGRIHEHVVLYCDPPKPDLATAQPPRMTILS
jgi:hypothetical protein